MARSGYRREGVVRPSLEAMEALGAIRVPASSADTNREDRRERARRRLATLLELPPPAPAWPQRLVVGLDAAGLAMAYVASLMIVSGSARVTISLASVGAALAWVVTHLAGLNHAALYRSHIRRSALEQFPQIALGATYGLLIDLAGATVLKLSISRGLIVLSWVSAITLVTAGRTLSSSVRQRVLARSPGGSATIVVGSGPLAHTAVDEINNHPEDGLRLVGYVEDGSNGEAPGGLPRFGEVEDLPLVVTTLGIGDVILAGGPDRSEILTGAVRSCARTEARVSLVAPHPDLMLPFGEHDRIGRLPLIQLVNPQHRPVARFARDVIDRVAGSILAVLVLPLVAVLAVLVKLDSPGPAFFRQRRIGKGGVPFEVFKLRTMVVGAEDLKDELLERNEADGPYFKIREDPRITRLGRFLRSTSLDELPQLFNVLRGEMSLVGPRPALQEEVLRYPFWFRRRLTVRPGVTGLWQVNGRAELSFTEAMRLDLSYVEGWSPWLDVQILVRTIGVVLFRRNAS
jgi:exopolysaccharide biosynthesis polyprenyl glycosylphosphotransferase